MIRLTWRQFRAQAVVAVGLLVVVAILFIATRPHLSHLYAVYKTAQAACFASTTCGGVDIKLNELDQLLGLVGTALVALPALLGAFWGAPLIAREFENGTHRLAWTQSVTRTRWLAAKVAVVGVTSIAVTGLLSLLVTWWSVPIDGSHQNRFGSGLFGARNVAPIGYAAFGFALGVAAGLLIRRTLPAMAATLVAFLGVRLAFTYAVRANLLAPLHKTYALDPNMVGFGSTNSGPPTLMPYPPNLPNAWVYSFHIVDNAGHRLPASLVASTCPTLGHPPSEPPPGSGIVRTVVGDDLSNALHACVAKFASSYHETVTYQPANRYWLLQWVETTVHVAAAVAILTGCFFLFRRRRS